MPRHRGNQIQQVPEPVELYSMEGDGRRPLQATYDIPEHEGKRSLRLPNPTLSQRRKSQATLSAQQRMELARRRRSRKSLGGGLKLANIFSGPGNQEEYGYDHERITTEEIVETLDSQLENLKPGDTIRLPSDILHRRKSRFPTADFQVSASAETAVGDVAGRDAADDEYAGGEDFIQNGYHLSEGDIARLTNREKTTEEEVVKGFRKVLNTITDAYQDATILKTTFLKIQGRFGSAIMEYFVFIKWLIMLNIFITLLTLILIVPQLALAPHDFASSLKAPKSNHLSLVPNITTKSARNITNSSSVERQREGLMESENCTQRYIEQITDDTKAAVYWRLADFIQGTGFMENKTVLFYGGYYDKTWRDIDGTDKKFNMGAWFLIVNFLVFAISMTALLWSCSTHLRRSVKGAQGKFKAHSCYAALASWDWGLSDQRSVKLKKNLIRQQLLQLTADSLRRQEKKERTTSQIAGLIAVRIFVNVFVVSLLGGSLFLIYYVQDISVKELASSDNLRFEDSLFFEYLPTIVITAIYMIIPSIFQLIVRFEKYKPKLELGVTISRILILRLASLGLLLFQILGQLITYCETKEQDSCVRVCGSNAGNSAATVTTTFQYCWENYIGQQVFKLVILDLAVLLGVTFLVEFPRKLIYDKLGMKLKLLEFVGQQEFDMPKNVMDLLYNQTLCWVGVFFSPFIPLIIALKMIIFFNVKRLSLFKNQKPSPTLSRSSDVYSFFLFVMLLSLLLAYITVAICVQFIEPSRGCGPFRVPMIDKWRMDKVVEVVLNDGTVSALLRDVIKVVRNPVVVVGLIGFLSCFVYYLITLSTGRSAEIKLLEVQLSHIITTKQFIYNRVRAALADNNNNNMSRDTTLESQTRRRAKASNSVPRGDDSVGVSANGNNRGENGLIQVQTKSIQSRSSSATIQSYDGPDRRPLTLDENPTAHSSAAVGYHNVAFIPDEFEFTVHKPGSQTEPGVRAADLHLQPLRNKNQMSDTPSRANGANRMSSREEMRLDVPRSESLDNQAETEFTVIRPQPINHEQPVERSVNEDSGGENSGPSVDDILLQRSGDRSESRFTRSKPVGGERRTQISESEDSVSHTSTGNFVDDIQMQRSDEQSEFVFAPPKPVHNEQRVDQENLRSETHRLSDFRFSSPSNDRDIDERSGDSSEEEGPSLDDLLLQRAAQSEPVRNIDSNRFDFDVVNEEFPAPDY